MYVPVLDIEEPTGPGSSSSITCKITPFLGVILAPSEPSMVMVMASAVLARKVVSVVLISVPPATFTVPLELCHITPKRSELITVGCWGRAASSLAVRPRGTLVLSDATFAAELSSK